MLRCICDTYCIGCTAICSRELIGLKAGKECTLCLAYRRPLGPAIACISAAAGSFKGFPLRASVPHQYRSVYYRIATGVHKCRHSTLKELTVYKDAILERAVKLTHRSYCYIRESGRRINPCGLTLLLSNCAWLRP